VFVFVLIGLAVIAVIKIPGLVRDKAYKEMIAFCFFLLAGFVLNLLLALGIDLPSPAKGIEKVLDAIGAHF
jgi:hypothetical protein